MLRKRILFLLIVMTLAIAGCVTSQKAPQVVSETHNIFIDPALKYFSNIRVDKALTPDGIPMVQIEGYNDPKNVQEAYYLVEWFDSSNMKINTSLSLWKKVRVQGLTFFNISEVGPSSKAVRYRVQMKKNLTQQKIKK